MSTGSHAHLPARNGFRNNVGLGERAGCAVFGHETRKSKPHDRALDALEIAGLVSRQNDQARHFPLLTRSRLDLASAL